MIIKTKENLVFDTADENCKLVIANDKVTVICINGKSKKKRYYEFWLSLNDLRNKPFSFELINDELILERVIMFVMEQGKTSHNYLTA